MTNIYCQLWKYRFSKLTLKSYNSSKYSKSQNLKNINSLLVVHVKIICIALKTK